MQFTSHGCHQSPLELVVENEALKVSETPLAAVDEHAEKENSSLILPHEVQIIPWQLTM